MRNLILILTLSIGFISACSTGPSTRETQDVYLGAGVGATLGEAINSAKMDAVRKAVIDMIGPAEEAANAAALQEVLYSTRNPNAYVFNETLEPLRKGGSLIDGEMHYELRIRVNTVAIRNTLEANGIPRDNGPGPSQAEPGSTASRAEDTVPAESAGRSEPSTPVNVEPAAGDWEDVTPEEERFIRRYVDTMTYMVYFNDESALRTRDGAFLMRSAVNQANSYLVSDGRLVVDAAQVEQLKNDQELAYEEETGREISILQWIARRLNADVYIELDARVAGNTRSGSHYGTADVTLNMYDASTGQVLGSVNRRSQEAYSRSSEQDAITNALLSTIYQAMPFAVDMARTQMAKSLSRGIRYELTIQNPPDARTMSRFRSAMSEEVREIASVSQTENEIAYEVFVIGSTDDIVDLVFSVSERVAGLEDLVLVIGRGRSVTFDAGY